jgi:flavodoxin
MKVIVAYMSLTGNTKKVAEAIFKEIQEEKEIKELSEIENIEKYDIAFVGFPVHSFGPPEDIKNFLDKHTKDKNLALFITHAMPRGMEMLEGIIAKCKEPASEANLIGTFDCQGALDENLAHKLLNHSDPQMQKFGAMREMTLGHPDVNEIENAQLFAREIMEKVRQT